MRAANGTSSTIKLWKSPIPFLFGSIAIVLLMIVVSLIMLVCSYRKSSASNSPDEEDHTEEKPAAPSHIISVLDAEPKIVVIMAGNDKPTYLAMPVTSSVCTCEQV
ncbi:hypothetical protein CCACVL1_29129 [Corchorus capsularis]|uniref:Uncharacterized protein n=1 Tax=Corchorus capsularis TaxID=210143 RepID=A0A1R3G3L5_COCAP|nr:hypothetical protein CCACVL1_29129 [Corchorus capsularis]